MAAKHARAHHQQAEARHRAAASQAPRDSAADMPPARAPVPGRPEAPVRVVIVDDHVLFREGLVSYFAGQPDFAVVGQAGSVARAVELARTTQPDVVLMDFVLLGGTGVEATRAILADRPGTKVVFLTAHEDDERLLEAIRAGAVGYMSKAVDGSDLSKTLHGVLRGEAGLSRSMAMRILQELSTLARAAPGLPDSAMPLTTRETEIVQELARGASNQEIAERLVITENTVKKHLSNVFEKLHLRSRRDLVDYARDRGLVSRLGD